LIEAQREGLSIEQAADAMVKDEFPRNRAVVIARTETIKATNFGAVMGAKKSGFQTEKLWISSRDARTRRIPRDTWGHLQMNGQIAQIDEPFKVPNRNGNHDSLQFPGDPKGVASDVIQCRCTVGFNVLRGENGLPLSA
jgi:uncharacterized protein with gpF-like domain